MKIQGNSPTREEWGSLGQAPFNVTLPDLLSDWIEARVDVLVTAAGARIDQYTPSARVAQELVPNANVWQLWEDERDVVRRVLPVAAAAEYTLCQIVQRGADTLQLGDIGSALMAGTELDPRKLAAAVAAVLHKLDEVAQADPGTLRVPVSKVELLPPEWVRNVDENQQPVGPPRLRFTVIGRIAPHPDNPLIPKD